MNRCLLSVAATVALTLGACSSSEPLQNTFRSSEALATAVLEAFGRSDRPRLELLALSEREFREHVWPDLPSARPERNLPFSYVWGDLHQKSGIRLSGALQEYGGKSYRLKGVRFGQTSRYAHYLVHRDSSFDVIDASGTEQSIRVCGSFLEKDGVWKVFSYVVDD